MLKSVFVKSEVGLFSILALVGACVIATDALATHVCPRCYHATITSTGSELGLEVRIGDTEFTAQDVAGTTNLFNFTVNNFPGQFVGCTYDKDPNDAIPAQNALCTVSYTCNLVTKGDCIVPKKPGSLGVRESIGSCDTPAVGDTRAGCRGTITVWDPNNPGITRLAAMPGGEPVPDIAIGSDLDGIVGFPSCKNQFPRMRDPALAMGVMVRMLSVCSSIDDTNVTDDPITSIVTRTDLRDDGSKNPEFLATGGVTEGLDGSCDTTTGFPATSCGTNEGQVHVTVVDNGTTVNAEACATSAAALKCGQRADGSFGPAPANCTLDSNGLCKCRCAKCDDGEPLVNSAAPGVGQFVLSDPVGLTGVGKKPWSAICSPVQTSN